MNRAAAHRALLAAATGVIALVTSLPAAAIDRIRLRAAEIE